MKNYVKISLQRFTLFLIPVLLLTNYSGCTDSHSSVVHSIVTTAINPKPAAIPVIADADKILNRPQVPILCYHQIRDWKPSDSRRAKDYIVPLSNFQQQMKFLADNGYHTILPDQLYDYLLTGKDLPPNPVMITFDDTRAEQYTIAREEMKRYGYKGVFFIMTVSLGRPGYMTREDVKELSDEGNTIGSHTWNHSNVKHYDGDDWKIQVDRPSAELREITGRPIQYFAYPFGLWDREALEQVKERGFKAAFQLSAKRDEDYPQFCIRRIIVPGEWSTSTLQKWMKQSF
jgi:peptidoglycan/xylan/chitin deacetylase (PgdA/CDA1 family)